MRERQPGPLSSSAFRIAAAALAGLVVIASSITFLLFRQSEAALTSELLAGLRADAAVIQGVDTIAPGTVAGAAPSRLERIMRAIEVRMTAGRSRLYLLVDSNGKKLSGNLDRMPMELIDRPGGGVFTYRRGQPRDGRQAPAEDGKSREAVAVMVTLDSGLRLLVGRDIEAEQGMLARMRWVAFLGMAGLALVGLAGGYAVARVFLGRLEAVNRTAASIMAGDMAQRIPVSEAGDEIDAAAVNLNRMLDRISQLMNGLREVSDNIAHDLKTPLNRLRNRAEAALRDTEDRDACRLGLEHTIEEADELIKTFNALLLIARLEAGALEGETEEIDIAGLVGDVAELYEPVAEEAGLVLNATVADGLIVRVNRHLISQAVANLIDNAIKYGAGASGRREPSSARQAGNGEPAMACGSNVGVKRQVATRVDVYVGKVANGIEISIADDGPGIGAADRERVLKRFVRLEQSRSRPGTGLGLSLVAAVARLHDGEVRLEDNAPGLRVVLRLPR